jgi:long-chain acyl-CoA synthetase
VEPARTLVDNLQLAAARRPDGLAITFGSLTVSYGRLWSSVEAAASGLRARGLATGDRVALLLPNHPAFVVAYYATLAAGGVVVCLNPVYPVERLSRLVALVEPRFVFALDAPEPRAKAEALASAMTGLELTLADADGGEFGAATPPTTDLAALLSTGRAKLPAINAQALAALQSTGGTTGEPKCAMLTHANLLSAVRQVRAALSTLRAGEERFLAAVPFSHVTGMNAVMNAAVALEAEMALVPRFTPAAMLEVIRDRRLTVIGGVPTLFEALLGAPEAESLDWDAVKLCIGGGAAVTGRLQAAFRDRFRRPIVQAYGMTECSCMIACMPADGSGPVESAGRPVLATQVRVGDPTNGPADASEAAELSVSGPQVMAGYYKDPEATTAVLKDGWLRTGDVGRIDEEGYVFLIDRSKDVIIASGYNVFPSQVEAALLALPEVQDAAVVGVPDAYRGETVKAFVVPAPGAAITLDQLARRLSDRLSPVETPKLLEIRDSLPRTPVGKVDKTSLR